MNGVRPNSETDAGSEKGNRKRKTLGRLSAVVAAAICAAAVTAGAGEPVWPEPIKEIGLRDGSLEADVSNAEDGYAVVRFESSGRNVKIGVAYEDEEETYFDADARSDYEIIPLNEGAGNYEISLYENRGDSLYEKTGEITVRADADASEKAFLAPNARVRYGKISFPALTARKELVGGTDEEILNKTKKLMRTRFCYDFAKALNVDRTGVLPDVRECCLSGRGVCGDLAATATALLRSAGVPTKYVEGTADGWPHAWTEVLVEGEWRLYDPASDLTGTKPNEYEAERTY